MGGGLGGRVGGEGLGPPTVSAQPSEGLETMVNHLGNQLCICDQAPIKTGHQGLGKFPWLVIVP